MLKIATNRSYLLKIYRVLLCIDFLYDIRREVIALEQAN